MKILRRLVKAINDPHTSITFSEVCKNAVLTDQEKEFLGGKTIANYHAAGLQEAY